MSVISRFISLLDALFITVNSIVKLVAQPDLFPSYIFYSHNLLCVFVIHSTQTQQVSLTFLVVVALSCGDL